MDVTTLHDVVRNMLRDGASVSPSPLYRDSLARLSADQRASVRALQRAMRRLNGDISALIPALSPEEWFFASATETHRETAAS